ncbi:Ig-like domain-containing protein, partial [Duganella callida]
MYRSVLFLDAGVADAAALAEGVADDVLVVKLVSWRNGVEQIASVLRQYQDLDSVQIVSHGAAGQIQLGTSVLDRAHLADYQEALQEWGAALRPGGDLLLYGCDVAAGDAGQAFIDGLAQATGADVAASTDATGSSALGANWDLERSTGSIDSAAVLSAQAEQDYAHTLNLANNGANGTITFNTNADVTLLNATGLGPAGVVHVDNILNLGFDLYAQSSNGGGVTVVNANGNSLIGLPLTDDRLTVNGSLLSPVTYVDLRANSGVFDMVSVNLGSGSLVGNLLGTVIFTVYALDANYQPTGVGVSLTSLVVNQYGLLNFASMADFKGIYGIRIVNPLGFEVAIDDLQVANARAANTITSAAYNAGTGVLSLNATGIRAGDAIDPTKLTITGANGASYTLTSPVVSASSSTAASITLNAADKLAINGLLNNNGSASVDGTSFNVAAAANWDSNLSNGVDLSGNPITVSNVQLPTISAASFNAATGVLTVTGSNLVGVVGAANDITVAKLTLKGEGGATRTLTTSGNVEVLSSTSFAVTLSGADASAVAALLNKNGAISAGGTSYVLSAADDWNSAIGNTNTAVGGVSVVVSNAVNSAPTITGAAAANVNDNATIQPFGGVTVADVNGDNVSLTISFNAANGTLSGAGLAGGNGSYTLSASSPAALTAQLKALVFTPTANQAAVGVGVNTTFTLTATDSNGAASAANSATVITATSVNDAPVLSGVAAGQSMTAGGTLRPFASVTLSDPDVGATVIVTVTPDSASKGAFTAASLAASGFVTTDGGVSYTMAASAPSAAQAALQALVYKSTTGLNATTTFTVTMNDGSVIVTNNATTVVSAAPSSTTALTVAFSHDSGISNSDLITNVAGQTISGTLSGNLAGGESVQVSLDNGATWTNATASVGASTWSLANQTLSGSGTLQVRVTNPGGSSTPLSASYVLDTTAPTTTNGSVAFSADTGASGTDLITKTAAQTISGTLGANLAAGEHVEVSLNNGASWAVASATGANSWQLAGQTLAGSNTLQVRVVDAAGNAGPVSSNAYVLDTAAPTAALSINVTVLGNGQTVPVTVSFSETPYNLSLASFTGVNGTVGNLQATADPRVYTIDFTPNGGLGGLLGSVQLAAGGYTDAAGNSGQAAGSLAVSISLGPTVLITSDKAAMHTGDTANITFTFSATPVGFTASDIVVSGGTLSGLAATANPAVYTAVFTPGANVTANASITVTGGSYTDGLGLTGATGLSPLIAVDTRAPTLAITSDVAAVHSGTSATITFTFSEVPVGFTASDVTVSNGTLSNFSATLNPLVYTATFTPNNGVASGAAGISVAAGAYTDLAGNSGGAGAPPSISIDTLAPSTVTTGVSFSNDTGASSTDLVTKTAAQTISGTLGSALQAGEVVQVSLDNGVTWANASAATGASSWSLSGVTLAGSNTLQVRVNDAAGNHGNVFSTGYVLDTTAPGVQVSSDLAALNAGQVAHLTFVFSEAPSNFGAGSIAVTGGAISNLVATANPLVYTAVFTPTAGQSALSATVQVQANGYTDVAGNGGAASAQLPIIVNTTLPSMLITSDHLTLKGGETANLTFTFSTPPTGFTAGDIAVSNGTLSGFSATVNPLVYTAVFTPTAGLAAGAATISVAAGSYTDAFGNSGNAAAGPNISIDTVAPSVAITSSVSALKAGETALITFTFSEAPTGFTAADVTVSGGALSALAASADPLVYTAVFTPTAGIQNVSANISIAAGGFTDAAGNANGGAATPPLTIDTQAPTAVANTVVFSADTGSSATDLVTNTAAQTISGTLASPLGNGEFVEVSLDNGASWTSAGGAGSAWSLSGQTLTASNTLQVRVSDTAGNHGTAFSVNYVLDNTAPTVSIGSSASALKAGQTAVITFTFSEAPSGFDLGDLNASGGTLSGLTATANPLVYTATFTPTANLDNGSGAVTLTAGGYTDKAGNAGGGASLPAFPVDTQAPATTGASVVFSSDSGASGDLVTNAASQTISGTLSANLQNGETVEVSLDNGNTWLTASGSAGTPGWSLANQTLSAGPGHNVQVRVSDAAGNHGAAFSAGYTLDQSAPGLVITSSKLVLNSADAPLITFTFSETPVGFSAASVTVAGGTLSGFAATANPLVYTAVFTPTAGQTAGVGLISVAAGAYTDLAGNNGLAAAAPNLSLATAAPGVAILSDVAALKAGDTANITFKFSSAPVGFTVGDVTVGGGTLSGFTATADPLVYTAVFTPVSGVNSASGAISIANNSYTDILGNPGVGGSMTAIAIDTLAPTLSIASSVAAVNGTGTALITFTFSEAPAAFSLGDISASNGTLSNLVQSANPLVYTALFTPAANVAAANAVISVAAGAYADAAGNGGAAGSSAPIAVDTLPPALVNSTVLFSSDTGSSSTDLITRSAAQTIAGTLAGGTLAAGDRVEVSLDNGASWQIANAPVGGATWSLSNQTLTGSNTLQVRVTDLAGNHGAVSSSAYVLDTTAPTVAISSSAATLRAGQSATISFTFSEAPAGFTLSDLIATGGTLSNFSATANPLVYTVQLTPTPAYNGNASVTLGNNLYNDVAGNSGSGATSPAIVIDTQPPTLVITSSSSSLKAGDSATIIFTFSDAQAGFSLGDITASNGTLSGLSATANPLVYTATFTPTAGLAGGNAVISVASGLYADAAGNLGGAASSAPIAVDTLAPTSSGASVAFSADNGVSGSDLITNAPTQILTGTLSAPLQAGETVQVSLDNGVTWLNAVSTGPGMWALMPQTLSGSGTLQVRVSDAAGNSGPAFASAYVLDQTAPGMTISSSASTLKAGEAATLTFTFSEAPAGFSVADLVAVNGTLSGFAATANPLVYTVVLTPTAGLSGSAGVTLAPGLYTDAAGNAGGAAASPLITVDTAPPTLAITSSAASLRIGESAVITFTFSEAPVGFTAADIAVAGGTLSGFGLTANPLVYTALFTPTPGVASGNGTITVAGGSFLDGAGNPGVASAVPPTSGSSTVVFSGDSGISNSDLITNNPLQTISGTLDNVPQSGETVEVSLDNGASWVPAQLAAGSGNWSLPAAILTGSGALQIRVTDGAGNHGAATVVPYTIDLTAPGVSIGASTSVMKAGDSATLSFTFTEVPQGFSAADLTVTGGALSGLAATANPLVYTATFTPAAGYNGTASVTLNAGSYTDIAGNAGQGGAGAAITVDAQPPTLTISSNAATLKAGETAQITFTFSEAPVGFAAGDVSASGGILSGFAATANPLVYTAVFT